MKAGGGARWNGPGNQFHHAKSQYGANRIRLPLQWGGCIVGLNGLDCQPSNVRMVFAASLKGNQMAIENRSISEQVRTISEALHNFDVSPESAHVRQPVVQALFACSAATVWRMVKRGQIPAPKKLSERVTAWNVGELRKALSSI